MIVQNLQQNARAAQKIIAQAVRDLPASRGCLCGEALRFAIITDRSMIPEETKERLAAIVGKYVS